jgi:hypothetical protein
MNGVRPCITVHLCRMRTVLCNQRPAPVNSYNDYYGAILDFVFANGMRDSSTGFIPTTGGSSANLFTQYVCRLILFIPEERDTSPYAPMILPPGLIESAIASGLPVAIPASSHPRILVLSLWCSVDTIHLIAYCTIYT